MLEIFISIHTMGNIQKEACSHPGSHAMNRWKKRGPELCPGPQVGRAELTLGPMPVLGQVWAYRKGSGEKLGLLGSTNRRHLDLI